METMICADCAIWHTNGDDSGAATPFEPTGDYVVTADEPISFYVPWQPCPSCGTTLAGTWYEAEER